VAGEFTLALPHPRPETLERHADNARALHDWAQTLDSRFIWSVHFGYQNVPASLAATAMWRPVAGSGGLVARQIGIVLPFDATLVAMALRGNQNVSAGSMTIAAYADAQVTGWGGLTLGSGQRAWVAEDPSLDVIAEGQEVQAYLSSSGSLLPSGTADVEATLWLARA
jgi:hypothetical protein